MDVINQKHEKTLYFLIYSSLMVLAIGLVTSISILSLFHILIIVPSIYFLFKTDYKNLPRSYWALCSLSLIIIMSVIFNQDIATHGYKNILKVKYFIFGFITIVPISWYLKNHCDSKKISYLLYAFMIATTFATIVGIYSQFHNYNPITMRGVDNVRNTGLFGMVMNYAHNLALFEIIVLGLIIYKKETSKYINTYFLYFVFIMNLVGLYMSYTRGAWLALLMGTPFYFFKKNKKLFIYVIALAALSGAIAYFTAGSMMDNRDRSNNERISQWQASIKAVQERPVFGYGYLNFETHSTEIKKRYGIGAQNFGGHAHNNFFEMLASTGSLGFIAFIIWLIFWASEMYKSNEVLSSFGLAFIITFLAGGLTQSTIALGINLFFIMAFYSISQAVDLKERL